MHGQHLLEQRALDGHVAAKVKWGVAQHLIDRFALDSTHDVLLLSFERSGLSSMAARRMRCRRIIYAISMPSAPKRARRAR
jgi:hypothetical protein